MDIYLAAWLATIAATQLPTHRKPGEHKTLNANIILQKRSFILCVHLATTS